MLDDADQKNIPECDLPDADAVYALYLETCKRLGVEPEARDRAQDFRHNASAPASAHEPAVS